ncbi:3-keto-steroid reductase-like protein [Hapsidospora chrysogenum ATCC 11550]|uniref:3-keto-steroid reductase-like protein n=1 Tax=Hapsidospora chrysogenum (strain ATCC 11550 / CBS 779.69 / DSM 880 / IAM 14645 / JCM 23072 / IMI 49137) TaxID=857340 RepID=A0A086TDW2_HAPC1|nr:3-keto-steroid reductase-like protein [Hapsidospora chrysogenum ATCC 11550]
MPPAGSSTPPRPAPWDDVDPTDQLFVVITGANRKKKPRTRADPRENSGIGLGTGERLIDEFLSTRPATAHLILIPTTRSDAKSRQTIRALRAHAITAAKALRRPHAPGNDNDDNGGDGGYRWEDHAARVHVLSLQLDLCDVRAVYELADRVCTGTLSNPEGVEGPDAELRDVVVPRLDAVVCNAAYGGWSGLSYLNFFWTLLVDGFIQTVTWPKCKVAYPTRILNQQPAYRYPAKPRLGEVFCACVFGHYLLAHQLLPLLSRPNSAPSTITQPPPGRIIWSSSVEAVRSVFDPSDIQCLRPSSAPYESAKRLTDILSLTHTLPSVRPISSSYLREDGTKEDARQPPKMYLTHPGVVASSIFPLPGFLFWAYHLALTLARLLGSPWHTVDAYHGSRSAAWVILQEQATLDELDGERVKWGSAANRANESFVKKTEVDGWGWTGRVEGESESEDHDKDGVVEHVLRKSVGRRRDVADVTKEELEDFEELGRECWEHMEELREEWEEILGL